MRCLGLDLGTRTLGVAISDKTNTLASFLKVIRFNDDTKNQMYEELCQIIKEYNITHVILGLPKNMDNSLGFASQRSIDFKNHLTTLVDVEIILLDERLTTVEAENILKGKGFVVNVNVIEEYNDTIEEGKIIRK